jgi:hypothetical protein
MNHGDDFIAKIRIRRSDEDECKKNGGKGGNGGKGPTATPYLLIPYGTIDSGQRPIPVTQAFANGGIRALISNPGAANGWADFNIQLSCLVANLGAVASAAGFAEFFVGDQFGIWNSSHQSLTTSQVKANAQLVGRAAFTAPPGVTTQLLCPNYWKPGSLPAAEKGVLVQVSDLFTDPVGAPFDAIDDRHVARNDALMDPIIHSVTVSGALSPTKKVDVSAVSLDFTSSVTGQKFSAPVSNARYSVLLPNNISYVVALTTVIAPRQSASTSTIGILNLNVSGTTFTFDISW